MKNNVVNVALVGNPNTGKTSLFNQLTGLKQKVGNYPGITVDKKEGKCKLSEDLTADIVDLPGTYSINPQTLDESIVLETLLNKSNSSYPGIIIVVAEVENLKRNLLLFSQIKDLQIPTILAINMADQMERKGINIDIEALKIELKTEIILISSRKNTGIDILKRALINYKDWNIEPLANISTKIDVSYFNDLESKFPENSLYKSWLLITQQEYCSFLTEEQQNKINTFKIADEKIKKYQHKETIFRYQLINEILKKTYKVDRSKATDLRSKLDKILTHKIFGYVIFAVILLLIFQSIFEWASLPMDLIDGFFANLSELAKNNLPKGIFTNLIAEGIIPGIGGIVIFIPQIAILFLFISILEENRVPNAKQLALEAKQSLEKLLATTFKNPETGNLVKVDSALRYKKASPAYKIASSMLDKGGYSEDDLETVDAGPDDEEKPNVFGKGKGASVFPTKSKSEPTTTTPTNVSTKAGNNFRDAILSTSKQKGDDKKLAFIEKKKEGALKIIDGILDPSDHNKEIDNLINESEELKKEKESKCITLVLNPLLAFV